MADWEDVSGQWEDVSPKLTRAQIRTQIQNDPITQGAIHHADDMGTLERTRAGAGKFFSDIGKGVAQWSPWGPSRKEIDESNERDTPLMATPAGFLGNLGAGAAASVPLGMIPGVNTAVGTTLAGGAFGAAQPVGQNDSRTLNTALGAGSSLLAKVGLDKLGGFLEQRASNKAAELAAEKTANVQRDAAIQEAQGLGYKITPNQAEAGSVAKAIEGLSGSAKMEKLASIKNQRVTNNLVREELDNSLTQLGLPDLGKKSLSPQTLAEVRKDAGQFYKVVDNLGTIAPDQTFATQAQALSLKAPNGAVAHPAEEAIDKMVEGLTKHTGWDGKSLRADVTRLRELAGSNFSAAKRAGGDVEKMALATAQSDAAKLLEDLAERNLAANGAAPTVIANFRQARQLMAKTYTVEHALDNVGNVSARDLAKSPYLTGGMKKAGDFAKNFEGSARDVSTMADRANFSAFDALLGIGGGAISTPFAAAALARPAARGLMLSDVGQSVMGGPNYNLPMTTRLMSEAANNPMLKRTLPLAAVPSVIGVAE
jgi:hypothetical protein